MPFPACRHRNRTVGVLPHDSRETQANDLRLDSKHSYREPPNVFLFLISVLSFGAQLHTGCRVLFVSIACTDDLTEDFILFSGFNVRDSLKILNNEDFHIPFSVLEESLYSEGKFQKLSVTPMTGTLISKSEQHFWSLLFLTIIKNLYF